MHQSNKHHYLPKFYLKGFTNEKGTFYIYDYRQKRINNKEFYPSAYFYDSRNFIEVNGIKDDLPETIYSKVDDKHSPLLKKIQEQNDVPILCIDEMLELQQFVASIFWRLPSNHEYFLNEYKTNPDFTKRMVFVNGETNEIDEAVTKEIIFNDAFILSMKPLMPLLLGGRNNADLDNWQFIYDTQGNFTCSDEPILFREEKPKDIFDSEFIFPLTKNLLLLRTFKKINRDYIPAPVISVIKLLLFNQGNFYCCSTDKNFLNIIKKEHSNLKLNKKQLFETLEDPEWLQSLHQQWLNKQNTP